MAFEWSANTFWAVGGCTLAGIGAGIAGSLNYLRSRSLSGDVVAHAVLPGICLGFLFSGTKSVFSLVLGGIVSGYLSLYLISFVQKNSRLKPDVLLAWALALFFGAGIFLLTLIQHSGNSAQSGLDKFIFGKAAALTIEDLLLMGSTSLISVVLVILFFRILKQYIFDSLFTGTMGLSSLFVEILCNSITVIVIIGGIQALGFILVPALLVIPPVIARPYISTFKTFVILSAVIGAAICFIGSVLSLGFESLPTGPVIVVTGGLLSIPSLIKLKR